MPKQGHLLDAAPEAATEIKRVKARFTWQEQKRNFLGQHFWARGYMCPPWVGIETAIREYIRRQKEEDKLDQINLSR